MARGMGRVRIIGGRWRGRWLDAPEHPGLRPTPDRVRETLFNWLQLRIAGARCLDAFAGSGALGFEAASRGAASVVMLENNPAVAVGLRDRARAWGGAMDVARVDSVQWLAAYAGEGFDLAFLDPPFGTGLMSEALSLLFRPGVLRDDARIYIERPAREALPLLPQGWEPVRAKTAGEVAYALIAESRPRLSGA